MMIIFPNFLNNVFQINHEVILLLHEQCLNFEVVLLLHEQCLNFEVDLVTLLLSCN